MIFVFDSRFITNQLEWGYHLKLKYLDEYAVEHQEVS